MEIKITKKLKLDNTTWYYVFKDDCCIEATDTEERANEVYEMLKFNNKKYEEVVIKSEIINV